MPEAVSSPSLFVQITPTLGMVNAKLIGPSIGQREVPIITDQIAAAISGKGAGLEFLVLDLSQVTFMNSMALGMCVDLRNRAIKAAPKTKVIILGMNAELTNLFKMVKFDKLFAIVKDAGELKKITGK